MRDNDPLESLREAVASELGRRMPPWARDGVTEGIAYRLMRYCWRQNSDVLGTEEDLQRIMPGLPQEIIAEMLRCGMLQVTHGEYIMPMAWKEAPEHVRSRWRDTLTDEDRSKMRERAKLASSLIRENPDPSEPEPPTEPEPEPEPEISDESEPPPSLWGEDLEVAKKKKPVRQPHIRRIIDHWFKQYEEVYGKQPAFTQRDAQHLKTALKAFGSDPARLEDALRRYLACSEQFFRGHPLSLFINQLNRWTTDQAGRGAGTGSRHTLDEDIRPNIL